MTKAKNKKKTAASDNCAPPKTNAASPRALLSASGTETGQEAAAASPQALKAAGTATDQEAAASPQAPESARDSDTRRAAEHYVQGLLTRGETVEPDSDELPSGATHKIVKQDDGELPQIERVRYSAF